MSGWSKQRYNYYLDNGFYFTPTPIRTLPPPPTTTTTTTTTTETTTTTSTTILTTIQTFMNTTVETTTIGSSALGNRTKRVNKLLGQALCSLVKTLDREGEQVTKALELYARRTPIVFIILILLLLICIVLLLIWLFFYVKYGRFARKHICTQMATYSIDTTRTNSIEMDRFVASHHPVRHEKTSLETQDRCAEAPTNLEPPVYYSVLPTFNQYLAPDCNRIQLEAVV